MPDQEQKSTWAEAYWQLRKSVFKQLTLRLKKKRQLPSEERILGYALLIVRLDLYKFMLNTKNPKFDAALGEEDFRNKFIKHTAIKITKYLLKTYDSSKVRKEPLTTRSMRAARNKLIVDEYLHSHNSFRNLAKQFNVSTKVITDALHNAGLHPQRDIKIDKLSDFSNLFVRLIDKFAGINRTSIFFTREIKRYMNKSTKNEEICIESLVEEINKSPLGYSIYYQINYIVISRGRKRDRNFLSTFIDGAINPNNNSRIHHIIEIGNYYLYERISHFAYIMDCLSSLSHNSSKHVIETLWLNSFKFADSERVKMILSRALNTDNRLHSIEKFARWEVNDTDIIARAIELTLRCCALNYSDNFAQATVAWLIQSDIKSMISDKDVAQYERVLKTANLSEDSSAFDAYMEVEISPENVDLYPASLPELGHHADSAYNDREDISCEDVELDRKGFSDFDEDEDEEMLAQSHDIDWEYERISLDLELD